MPIRGPNKDAGSARLSSDAASEAPPRGKGHSPGAGEERARQNAEERLLLLRFAREGDRRAFDELVRRTEARVRAVALVLLGDPAAAEDAAQEAFLRAFRRASAYRGEGSVGAWLCRISVRCAQDALRRAGRRRRLFELVRGQPDREPVRASGTAERLGLRAELVSALRLLPDAEREALLLKEVAGMTYREIAETGGIPLGTVQSRIHRARRRLASALHPERKR